MARVMALPLGIQLYFFLPSINQMHNIFGAIFLSALIICNVRCTTWATWLGGGHFFSLSLDGKRGI